MSTIGSIGIGLFLLIIIWILTLIVFVVAIKYQSNLAWVSLGPATVVTVILLSIPIDDKNSNNKDEEFIDKNYTFIYRKLCLCFVTLSAIVGLVSFFLFHCIKPVQAKPLQNTTRKGVYYVPR